jgi:hypothetical protein
MGTLTIRSLPDEVCEGYVNAGRHCLAQRQMKSTNGARKEDAKW